MPVPLRTLPVSARYWHCSSAHHSSVCLGPRGDHRRFHLSSFSLVSVTLVVCFIAFLCLKLCWHAAIFLACLDTRPSKENRRSLPHEDSLAAGCRQPLLVCATVLSSPVSCQNRKRQGRKWRPGKCCLDVYWLEVQLCLTVTLVRKNRTVQGVTHGGILHSVIFITFTKHWGIIFAAVDTGLGHFLSPKQCSTEEREMSHLTVPLWLTASYNCSLFRKGNPSWYLVNHKSKTLLFFRWSLDLQHNNFSVWLRGHVI